MANFRSNDNRDSRSSRGGFGDRPRSRFGGGRSERGGFRRDSGRFERKPLEMHDATCSKCGKECQVPFRPSGSKPVLCSDCFRQTGSSDRSFSPRGGDRSSQSGISSKQLSEINAKLDKIIKALEIDSE
ncbi:hypothetical protein HYW76_04465 [Candidatus Pacearchaeota archaeon]|nr:hypothetical protein [Candidatus Pacearchaeota archaeon]